MKHLVSICSFFMCCCLTQGPIHGQSVEVEAKRVQCLEHVDRMIADAMYNLTMSEVPGYKQRETGTTGIPCPNGEGDPDPLRIDMRQGTLAKTGRSLDVAIDGEGFFRVIDGRTGEIVYTRYGVLEVNAASKLCLVTGNVIRLLEPEICIPDEHNIVEIRDHGVVWTAGDRQSKKEMAGQIKLSIFAGKSRLKPIDEFFLMETDFSGPPTKGHPGDLGYGVLKGGYLESSNVDAENLLRKLKRLQTIRKALAAEKDSY